MDRKALFSPRQIGVSFLELFWRSGQWLLWLLTVVVAGAVGIGERFEVKNISNHAWFRVAVAGAIVSLAVAYHRTRLEREAAHAKDVRADHLDELQRRLEIQLRNVECDSFCEYQDAPGSARNEAAFKAHYPDLESLLDDWDDAVYRVIAARKELEDMLREAVETTDATVPWYGMARSAYDVDRVRFVVQELVVARAEKGTLDEPCLLAWRETSPFPPYLGRADDEASWKLELGGFQVAVVLDLPAEDRAERMDATKRPVEALVEAARDWEPSRNIRPSKVALAELRVELEEGLDDWKKATGLRVTRRCSVCRKNEGWPEPKPPLWCRARVSFRALWFKSGRSDSRRAP
jgi:hypothetical protein